MNHRLRRQKTTATLSAALAYLSSVTLAWAEEPNVQQCLSASEEAIARRGQHQLLAAREQLLVCASTSCPAEIRDECARRVDEINLTIPTVVFAVKDSRGHDLSGVRMTVDGRPFAEQLQGVAIPFDPGRHVFSFEVLGQPPVYRDILIVEGAKARHETVVIGTPQPEPSPAKGERADTGGVQRILGWSAVGAGVVGVGLGVFFELKQSNTLRDADAICPEGSCPPISGLSPDESDKQYNAQIAALTDSANDYGVAGTVAFVAGGVFLAGGIALVLTAPSGDRKVSVLPAVGPGFQGMAMTAQF